MDKKMAIGILALILIVAAGAALLGRRPQENNPAPQPSAEQQNAETAGQETQPQQSVIDTQGKTLKDFMDGKLGKDVRCDFSQATAEGNRIEGTTYVAEKKVRIDYKLQMAEGQREMHMISDGTYGYVWGDALAGSAIQGTKFKIDTDAAAEAVDQKKAADTPDYEKAPITNCEVWSVEAGKFEVPADVSFADMESLQSPALKNPAAGTDRCATCDALAGDQKSACQKALDCNQ